jgi:V/A-type H+-transporting ATPase subunit D
VVFVAMVPTKGNLIIARNTLKLCRTGFELLDEKRNILVRELIALMDTAKELQNKMSNTFDEAYLALQRANIEMGIDEVEKISHAVEIEDRIEVKYRSVMGVEIPIVIMPENEMKPVYGFKNTSIALDIARHKFNLVKSMTKTLAQVENSIYRLADSIKKAQKRANALKNIMIPKYEQETKLIQNFLEEKEREEFSRLKVIKVQKESRRKNT